MIKFSKEKVLLLHKLIAEETGGSIGVRDEALLESALENVFSSFGGQEFYPTKEEKGARLGYALISNHAFVDGNKRIGMYVMLTFLEVNGIRLDCTNDEVVEVGLAVASGAMDYEALLAWLDGNNGKSAERTVVKRANRSRNDSDSPLRQPTDQKAGGSNPSRRTTANLLISMGSRFLFYLSMNSICLFSNVFLTSLTQAFCQLICKALLSGSV